MTILRLAVRNIRRHLRYSVGAFLSVATGFFALCLFRAYIVDVDHLYQDTYESRNMYGDLLVERDVTPAERRAEPWASMIDEASQAYIDRKLFEANPPPAGGRVRFLQARGAIGNTRASAVFVAKGYDIAEGTMMRGNKWERDTAAGVPLQMAPDNHGIVIGRGLAETLGCEVPRTKRIFAESYEQRRATKPFSCTEYATQLEAATEAGQSNAVEGQVVGIVDGIFKEVDAHYLMMPLQRMQALYDTKSISFLSVKFGEKAGARAFVRNFNADPETRTRGLRAVTWEQSEDGDMYRRTMELLIIFRNFVVSILIAITGLSVFNTFLKAVKERTREIGTMRSMGFRRRAIVTLFAIESVLLSAAGVLVGTLVSALTVLVVNEIGLLYKAGLLSEPVPFRLAFEPSLFVTSGVFLLAVAMLASVCAAATTASQRVADNLAAG